MNTFSLIVGSTVASLTFLIGVLVLLGYLLTPETAQPIRIGVGALMMLFGIYRAGLLVTQRRQSRERQHNEPPAGS
jgi:uncharacterized membrane protein